MVPTLAARRRVLLELLARVRPGRDDEEHGRRGARLLAHAVHGQRLGRDGIDAELAPHESGHRRGEAVRPHRLHQEELSENAGAVLRAGGHARLRVRRPHPVAPLPAVFEVVRRRDGGERTDQAGVSPRHFLGDPPGHGAASRRRVAGVQPEVKVPRIRVGSLLREMTREVHAEGESVGVEDAPADVSEDESKQRVREHVDPSVEIRRRRALSERAFEQRDERVQTELVHVVQRA
mmetsp:Transcript_8281/g.35123  ORF Transcript_8281/g.35123 Transcript_8281/m.35123 type:complete len:235 (-) Transcript_8281:7635-8339(-)